MNKPSVLDQSERTATLAPRLATLYRDDLPPGVVSLVELLGLPAAIRLVDCYGGISLRIPHGKNTDGRGILQALTNLIGQPATTALVARYAATVLYIPSCRKTLVRARNRQILAERATMAQNGMSERNIVIVLALRYGLSDRSVWSIFKQPELPPARLEQGRLC